MSDILEKAQARQIELIRQISDSAEIISQRPLFHFATPGGWCNDPNGFSQFRNQVHLFYQYHPYSTQWGPMHWGHAISTDMLFWEHKPVALAPDSDYDLKGCFSGTALEDNGKHVIAYTGVSSNGKIDVQNQCIAIGDGLHYEKIFNSPVLTARDIPFQYQISDFRDPKIWKKDGRLYMVCVIKKTDNRGAMVIFESKDLEKWIYKGILDSSKDGLSNMWECPDISTIDGNDVIIFSPQEVVENSSLGFHNGNNSVYMTGKLDYENCSFTRHIRPENGYTAALVDYGIDFYAPETTKLSDGRTIMTGWMQAWESYITPENYLWSGMMTLPRELTIKNNRLCQSPVRELEKYRTSHKSLEIKPDSSENASTDRNPIHYGKRHFELDLVFSENATGTFILTLGDSGNKKNFIILELNFDRNVICFDRSNTFRPGNIPSRQAKIRSESRQHTLKLICDTCSIEAFLDDGIMTFTNAFFLKDEISEVSAVNHTDGKICCDLWQIELQQT